MTESDGDFDAAITAICERMKTDRDKSRMIFYYLLAEKYAKLAMFH